MERQESGFSQWSDDWVVEQIAGALRSLEGVEEVKWTYISVYAIHQYLIRLSVGQGEAIRLGVAFVEDEEDQEAFDDSFPPFQEPRQHFLEQETLRVARRLLSDGISFHST